MCTCVHYYTRTDALLLSCVPDITTRCDCSEYLHAAVITVQHPCGVISTDSQVLKGLRHTALLCAVLRAAAADVINTALHLRVT
jgi:hypothetical protein